MSAGDELESPLLDVEHQRRSCGCNSKLLGSLFFFTALVVCLATSKHLERLHPDSEVGSAVDRLSLNISVMRLSERTGRGTSSGTPLCVCQQLQREEYPLVCPYTAVTVMLAVTSSLAGLHLDPKPHGLAVFIARWVFDRTTNCALFAVLVLIGQTSALAWTTPIATGAMNVLGIIVVIAGLLCIHANNFTRVITPLAGLYAVCCLLLPLMFFLLSYMWWIFGAITWSHGETWPGLTTWEHQLQSWARFALVTLLGLFLWAVLVIAECLITADHQPFLKCLAYSKRLASSCYANSKRAASSCQNKIKKWRDDRADRRQRNPCQLKMERLQLDTLTCTLTDNTGCFIASRDFQPVREASVASIQTWIAEERSNGKAWIELQSDITDSMLKDTLVRQRAIATLQSHEERLEEVSRHATEGDFWIAINGKVYDISDYLASRQHPGGNVSILEYGGKDASEQFNLVHPISTLDSLSSEAFIGHL